MKSNHLRRFRLLAPVLVAWIALATGAGADGFKQVSRACRLAFPEDHGPHPDYRTEWWYYTGNVADDAGRRFGFQLTFFRRGLQSPKERELWPNPASPWRSDQVYLAHAAISDIDGGRHHQAEQMLRPVLGLAGTDRVGQTVKIHLNDWRAAIGPEGHHIEASADNFSLRLDLNMDKPAVVHGDGGYSRKGPAPEQASCYYSFTRLAVKGTLSVDGSPHEVGGTAWMDHEFSTAPLAPGIIGWDWFSLQMSDRTEVMVYLLRQADGSVHPASSGSYVDPSGQPQHLERDAIRIRPRSHWTSPHSGARYPVRWRVDIAPLGLELEVAANLADQEMHTPRSTDVVYWEGSVKVNGTRAGEPLDGAGYVELTGYAKPFDAPM
jgi:predicted secreted hydrolase